MSALRISGYFLLFCLLFFISTSTVSSVLVFYWCPNTTTYSPNSTYRSNLNQLFLTLSSNATRDNGYYGYSVGRGPPDRVIGLFLCRGDVNTDVCEECVRYAATEILQRCPKEKEAIIWYDNCMLWYSNRSIISRLDLSFQVALYNPQTFSGNLYNFIYVLVGAMKEATQQAANKFSGKKFATEEGNLDAFQTLYTLAQCTPDLSIEDCDICLRNATSLLPTCCEHKQGASVYSSSCYIRYEMYPFYNTTTVPAPSPAPNNKQGKAIGNGASTAVPAPSPAPNNKQGKAIGNGASTAVPAPSPAPNNKQGKAIGNGASTAVPAPSPAPNNKQGKAIGNGASNRGISRQVIIAIVVPIVVSLVVLLVGLCFLTGRTMKKKQYGTIKERNEEYGISTVEALQYELNAIDLATTSFSADNKIGAGGFGDVYKGILPDGRGIAVKRLSKSSSQGAIEFKNEIVIVAKLQHKNLTRLLGFCLEGEEKILIYEFVPNRSLDHFLFDPEKQRLLDWSRRYKIIEGIARGMLYLHEDSLLKIVHRDLKASNILLDGDMNPKISDFGLARIFDVEQSQENTIRIAGTYGYMAPEYALHGQFSVKSDVFSFGVLILEIISGKKSNGFYRSHGTRDLISYAWKLWRNGAPLELMDPTLQQSYVLDEVIRCIQIGLLCVEEDVNKRPKMASILLMLKSYSDNLPIPRRPAYFISSGSDSMTRETDPNQPQSINEASISELCPR